MGFSIAFSARLGFSCSSSKATYMATLSLLSAVPMDWNVVMRSRVRNETVEAAGDDIG